MTCLILTHGLTCVAVGKRSAGSADYLVFEHSLPTKLYVTFFPDLHNSQKSFNLVEWGFVLFALMKISRISQLKIVEAMSESISGFPWWGSATLFLSLSLIYGALGSRGQYPNQVR